MTFRLQLTVTAATLWLVTAATALAQGSNDVLPDGPGKDVIVRACTMCHDASQIVYRPRTPDDWTDLIGSMMDRGAQLTPQEQDSVFAYLVKNFGKTPQASPAPAAKGSPGR